MNVGEENLSKEEQLTLEENIQGFDQEGQEKRISRIQKDIDKLNIYL